MLNRDELVINKTIYLLDLLRADTPAQPLVGQGMKFNAPPASKLYTQSEPIGSLITEHIYNAKDFNKCTHWYLNLIPSDTECIFEIEGGKWDSIADENSKYDKVFVSLYSFGISKNINQFRYIFPDEVLEFILMTKRAIRFKLILP